jgi:hypothetical protein
LLTATDDVIFCEKPGPGSGFFALFDVAQSEDFSVSEAEDDFLWRLECGQVVGRGTLREL